VRRFSSDFDDCFTAGGEILVLPIVLILGAPFLLVAGLGWCCLKLREQHQKRKAARGD